MYKLNKGLYGLKKAYRKGNIHLHKFLTALGFKLSQEDPTTNSLKKEGHFIMQLVYVDDV